MSSRSAQPPHTWSILNPGHPIKSLFVAFWVWKSLVLVVIACCPGPGYETSLGRLPSQVPSTHDSRPQQLESLTPLPTLLKFVRWDAVYFVHIAEHGYVYEQEWAFGYGYTQVLSFLVSVLRRNSGLSGATAAALVGIVLSHMAHFLSVLVLYRLSINVFGQDTATRRLTCFLSATLHIICPAGAFLSAPYAESLFSFLNMSGFYIYSSSFLDDNVGRTVISNVKLLIASVLFAAATTVRSNGILSGCLLAYDAVLLLRRTLFHGPMKRACLRLCVTVVGGCIVAAGMIFSQALAYADFCLDVQTSRPWCGKLIPSIYPWVQRQYWDVGFLRYWTIRNLPFFLLAIPMLHTLCRSSMWAMSLSKADSSLFSTWSASLLARLALPQGLLAVLGITSYHTQIINRICSGYPLWYWYLACQIVRERYEPRAKRRPGWTFAIQAMVIYAILQAALYGSFLPPP
ncbi:GPI mannosyltransferase 2 [Aspergillus nomiae NRRL 13137]|uniref:GPI mannosyltransferase 2 n=1 Tax=Aspergillus nomiae NRRL (strain ATCC 15546 / NRRL 13137 / CBS 260.88 / M93) TaxID=1509407 RepID=A0A0L1J9N5_ASPN3|nr:GPI mannosyltransferase 2 [Aspergillus nomiae NRRL 13137]KNG88158.1 GPI mannosyltransferase 2 [Aspergillus nomiae NRRL 13137]